jgi:SWI/SNF-related matrix-associated actin-dependent regulator 1 of chromatin subfamily A
VKELHEKLTSNVMIRVKKCDVLKDLPGKTRTVIPFEIDLKEYLEAEENLIEWLKKVNPDKVEKAQSCEALTKIGYLKRLSAKSKIKEVCAWVKTFLDTTDQKIILFGVHHEILDEVYRIFKKEAVLLTGETKQEDRKKAVYSFQNDPKVRVFIGGIKSAGVGLTLTSASTVAFVEMGWTPGEHLQCESRASRIGQKSNVTCYYLLSKGTIEVDICQIIQKKQEVIEALVDGHESVQDWDVYSDLIKRLKSKHKPS